MTPREISLLLLSRKAEAERRDRSVIALSRLSALAFHAPDRLPSLPPSLPSRAMSPEEIKQRLLAWRGKDDLNDAG